MSNELANEIIEECVECGHEFTIEDTNSFFLNGNVYCKVCVKQVEDNESEDSESEDNESEDEMSLSMIKYEGNRYYRDIDTNIIYTFDLTLENINRLGVWNDSIKGIDFDCDVILK
jgi:hypothetical protein